MSHSDSEEEVPQLVSEDEEEHEDRVDDLSYDLFNLSASSFHPLRFEDEVDREKVIHATATATTQLLFNKLYALPTENTDQGPVTVLPSEVAILPRRQRVPEPKPETKWEKFAREKGIKKHKRDRMVYDELEQEFRPRFGYKRANNGIADHPIVEIKANDDPYLDPWAEEKKEKKERVKKNSAAQAKNQAFASKKLEASRRAMGLKVPAVGVPIDLAGKKRGKEGVRKALQLAQISTASMGRYDSKRNGEPDAKLANRKRSFRDNFGSSVDEKKAMKNQIRFVADKKSKKERGVTNSLAAYEGILPDAPEGKFTKAKGRKGVKEDGPAKKKSKKGKH